MENRRVLCLGGLVGLMFTLAGACGFETGGISASGGAGTTSSSSPSGSSSGVTMTTSTDSTSSSTTMSSTSTMSSSGTTSSTSSTSSSTSSTSTSTSSGMPLGAGCMMGSQCASGNCANMLCCDMACTGTCMSCKGSDTGGMDGHCLPVKAGMNPGMTCGTNMGACNGSGACACQNADPTCGGPNCPKCMTAQACGGDGDCTTGDHCQNGNCCPATCMGACYTCNLGPDWAPMCTSYHIGDKGGCGNNQACNNAKPIQGCTNGGANGDPCTGNSGCVSGNCSSGHCAVPAQNMGWPCADQSQCDSGGCQGNHFCG